jgi:hypothetical protein
LSCFILFWAVFPFYYHIFCFTCFMCSPNFLAMFSISTKSCLISISFFPINTMSSAYGNIVYCYLPIFIPLGTIFILCITFCNAKLNNTGDSHPVSFLSKLTTLKPNHCFNTENPNAQCSGQHLLLCLEKYSKQHNICLLCTSMMAACVRISTRLLYNWTTAWKKPYLQAVY